MIQSKNFIEDILKRLRYYKMLGDKTFEQLEEKYFFYQPNGESNSIAIIIQHMHGNMKSRFTNFLTEDGEKPWRNRDAEFELTQLTKHELTDLLDKGWAIVLHTVESLQEDELMNEITIRAEKLFVYDALFRQLAHNAYHIGQIIYIAKSIKDDQWQNLSMPKPKK